MCQCKNIAWINITTKISGLTSGTNSYEIITDKITQRRVVVAQMKCFNHLTEKKWQKYGNFKIKTGGAYRSRRRCFWGNGCCNFKKDKPLPKIIGRKKLNDILFEIELSDYKKQQSHPMNEHFGGPINMSNSSNMTSQNSYSIPKATYGKTSLRVSLYDGESSTYSELILF